MMPLKNSPQRSGSLAKPETSFSYRLIALFLTLSLILPSSSFALKPIETSESPDAKQLSTELQRVPSVSKSPAGLEEEIPAKNVRKFLEGLGAFLNAHRKIKKLKIDVDGNPSFQTGASSWEATGYGELPASLKDALKPGSPPAKVEVIIESVNRLLGGVFRQDLVYFLTHFPKILSVARQRAGEQHNNALIQLDQGI